MPRYFFDVDDGATRTRDESGMDLAGPDALGEEAFNLLRDLVHDRMPEGLHTLTVTVRDEHGEVAYCGEMIVNGTRFRP